jgi:hypothetical protein
LQFGLHVGIPVGDFDVGVPGLAHLHIAVHPGIPH